MAGFEMTGTIEGRRQKIVWVQDAGFRADFDARVRAQELMWMGEWVKLTPEGPAFEAADDDFLPAYATALRIFDEVEDVVLDGLEIPEYEGGVIGQTGAERAYATVRKWTSSLHPRWPKGTPGKGGKFKTAAEIAAEKSEVGAGKDVIDVGGDVRRAARLLAEGKAVRLRQPRQVSVLLDELAKIVHEAEEKGEKAPDYDLCKVTVRNTSLFCVQSKGIPRIQMPQLKGVPKKGSPAASMKKDAKGEVDLTPGFVKHLQQRGFKTTNAREHAAYLKASQNELNGAKVAGMVKWMRGGGDPNKGGRMLVTEDNYIVDGHHRWAATVALDAEDNRLGDDKAIGVTRIGMDIIELLQAAVEYANAQGIPNAGFAPR